ncbi:M23 family metallopeptidase [Roseibium polysiphoniae]|uniref:M23 family metallopeptidase n=1 Tax=Roseibium polysiphoniae TaxID=2571221 RepID=A0ABR9CGI3_9HYPH|nr:peptidoglycan DD-metalloendopeptidase family protein [Roseibium polysiphoniae]MBD8878719.1 M23 family metallopeptidase [Roseibium polysiphoniae]
MPFSPVSVDLKGERISSKFGEMRDGCPHKGIDITSSKQKQIFTAGVFGTVGRPTGTGDWGTITVHPLHAPSDRIQYLHCSSIAVSPGQRVVPWSVLGTTGDTAPPNTGITGIHLHLHVETSGTGPSCWKDRFFVDPEKYPTPDAFRGQWRNQYSQQQGPLYVEYDNTLVIQNSLTKGRAGFARATVKASAQGCTWVFHFGWELNVVAHELNGTLGVTSRNGTQNRPVSCGITGGWQAVDGEGHLKLESASTMSIVGNGPINGVYNRVSSFAPTSPVLEPLISPEDGLPFLATTKSEIGGDFDFFEQLTSQDIFEAQFEKRYLMSASNADRDLYFGALSR